MSFRIGTGFDVHRLKPGDGLFLGGYFIKEAMSLIGHSDADVILHALTDALLGALGERDIGFYFSDKESINYRRDSRDFVTFAISKMEENGYKIENIDVVVICEKPKINTYYTEILKSLATILNVDLSQIGLKGKTTEKLGFTGREEGIAVQCVLLLSTK